MVVATCTLPCAGCHNHTTTWAPSRRDAAAPLSPYQRDHMAGEVGGVSGAEVATGEVRPAGGTSTPESVAHRVPRAVLRGPPTPLERGRWGGGRGSGVA